MLNFDRNDEQQQKNEKEIDINFPAETMNSAFGLASSVSFLCSGIAGWLLWLVGQLDGIPRV